MNALILPSILLIGAGTLAADSYTYQTISIPGASSTSPAGIDNAGDVVGNYTTSNGTYGFIDSGGAITTLAPGVSVINVSENGHILVNTPSGYAIYAGGTYTPYSPPSTANLLPGYGATTVTLSALNDSGQVLANPDNFLYPLLFTGNQISSLGPLAFDLGGEDIVSGDSLANDGFAAGSVAFIVHSPGCCASDGAIYNPSTQTWTYVEGQYRNTTFSAVNDLGQAVGTTLVLCNGCLSLGVLYDGGVLTDILPPGATASDLEGINDSGQIVGDADGSLFLATPTATPTPEPGGLSLGVLGVAGGLMLLRRR